MSFCLPSKLGKSLSSETISKSIKNPYYQSLKKQSKKQPLTLLLDDEIVTWYKSNEAFHQAEINTLLKEYIKNH